MSTFPLSRRVPALLVAGMLAGGSAAAQDVDPEQRLARYQQVAGKPVQGFRVAGPPRHWEAMGQSHLVVWASPGEAYVLALDAPCPALGQARAITLGGEQGRVEAGSSALTVTGGEAGPPCRVQTIQPLDTQALRQLPDQRSDDSGGT